MIVSVDGAELFYTTKGQGPACLFLSSIGTKPYERQTPPQLSDRFKLAYVDLRGSGRSTGDPTSLTFDVLADDLEAVRADLGVEQIMVMGHSILGLLAIEYARRRPDTVSHVIAVGIPPTGDMAGLAAKAMAFFEEDAAEDRKQVLRDNFASLPPDASMRQALFAQTPMRFFDARLDPAPLFEETSTDLSLLQHIMGKLTPGWDVTVGAESLRVPLLLAHGRYDYTVPYTLWNEVVPKLPNAKFHLFERSGHQPFFEEPERFAEILMDWRANSHRP